MRLVVRRGEVPVWDSPGHAAARRTTLPDGGGAGLYGWNVTASLTFFRVATGYTLSPFARPNTETASARSNSGGRTRAVPSQPPTELSYDEGDVISGIVRSSHRAKRCRSCSWSSVQWKRLFVNWRAV